MKNNKGNIVIAVLLVIVVLLMVIAFSGNKESKLPTPEITGGERGEFGIDKNINEETIDKYLGRSDSVYRDVRMLKDPGNFESIGGDSYLSGFVKGFEVISLPYIIPVTGLPESVGQTYTGKTLFSRDPEGKLVPNYEESHAMLEYYFPKDKNIFLMCGAGGYAGMMKSTLIELGWDESKIYNIGGYWFYNGKNNVEVKNEKGTYDFWKVTYHDIDFNSLTEVK